MNIAATREYGGLHFPLYSFPLWTMLWVGRRHGDELVTSINNTDLPRERDIAAEAMKSADMRNTYFIFFPQTYWGILWVECYRN